MKDLAHFYPAIAMRMGPASSRHQFPTSSLALVPQLGIVVMGVTQHVAHLPRQLVQQDRGDLIVPPSRNGQPGSQRDPHPAYGDSEVQLPPIPPAMPARVAPPGFSIHRGMRDDALLPMFFVPDASTRFQRRTIDRHSTPLRGPRLEQAHQGAPYAADQAWQTLRERGQTALPGAACRKAPVLRQQRPQMLEQRIILVEKCQESIGLVETANNHDNEGLHDEPVGIRLWATA